MKQGLQLKLGQQLTMTPQLQQAIRLLQLSALDLQQEIQQSLESNPLLELDEPEVEFAAEEAEADADQQNEFDGPDSLTELDGREDSVPDELPVDTNWEDLYQEHTPSTASNDSGSGSDVDFTEFNSAGETLQDTLYWQLNLVPLSTTDQLIAETIIEAINVDGMLTQTLAELADSLNANLNRLSDSTADSEQEPVQITIDEDEVLAVLKLVQQFEPAGIAARDLAECLTLQLAQLPWDTPLLTAAQSLVANHLNVLAARDFTSLKRLTKLNPEDLTGCVQLIQSLNPRPGSAVASEAAEYVVPDVFVRKYKGRWLVELNGEATPKVRINQTYAGLIKRADNSADNNYLKDNLQEAKWFLKSLQSRNETLLKVATRIVEHQRGFFEYGAEAMKPLVLNEIAELVEMHESTISRVTSRKYMHTPRGIFELKYFFSSHVGTTTGGEISSTAIRALIKKMTGEENTRKPLSDNKITALLKEQNIKVARRTVAKYRESLGIPPSNERKRLV
jgi:RNA polymerase sigma-54 factor